MKKIEYIVMIVGVGGTGGNFAKEFGRYASFFKVPDKSIKMVLIDGDHVEHKNEERQPFIAEDEQQSKALTLTQAIRETFDVDVQCFPHYINKAAELTHIYNELASYSDSDKGVSIPVILGCVDNHRARQCMHQFFEQQPSVFYFDSANEFSVGEVVIASKLNNTVVAPDRSFYYPEILKDTGPSAQEISCGAENISTPQHLATNLFAADLLLSAVVNVVSENIVEGGIVYFDRQIYFSRFQSYDSFIKGGMIHA